MYAQIEVPEITKLATLKAGGLATLTYMVLAAHDWGRGSCFPSLKTIADKLGGAYHTKSIQRALKWLEDNGLIKRQEATSKQRFTMVLRKVKEAVTNRFQRPQIRGHKNQMKRRNNPSYYSKRGKINKSSKNKQVEGEIIRSIETALECRSAHKWWNDPANSTFVKQSGVSPTHYPMPDKRPAKWSNEQVYSAINRRWSAQDKTFCAKVYEFWVSLQPVKGFSF